MRPFTVMATIHGPAGWFDVVDTKAGETVAVCERLNEGIVEDRKRRVA